MCFVFHYVVLHYILYKDLKQVIVTNMQQQRKSGGGILFPQHCTLSTHIHLQILSRTLNCFASKHLNEHDMCKESRCGLLPVDHFKDFAMPLWLW